MITSYHIDTGVERYLVQRLQICFSYCYIFWFRCTAFFNPQALSSVDIHCSRLALPKNQYIGGLAQCDDDCVAKGMSPNTIIVKRQSLRRFCEWCASNGLTRPQETNLKVMEGLRVYLHHYKKQIDGEPLSINSQHKFLTDLKLFLRRLHRRLVIANSDFEEFEMPKCKRRLPRSVLPPEEVERIFTVPMLRGDLVGIRDRAILELYYASAIRRSELAKIMLSHIDLDKQLLMIIGGKGLKGRHLQIAQRACDSIRSYLNNVRPRFDNIESKNALFVSQKGLPLHADQVGQMVGKYVRRSSIDKLGAGIYFGMQRLLQC